MEVIIQIFFLFFLFLLLTVGIYMAFVFCLYKLGQKFGIGSFWGYMLPVYNLYLINQCAGLPFNYLLINLIPFVGPIIYGVLAFGKIAEKLGKDYWLYGLGSAILVVPLFIMAFDQSTPNQSTPVHQEAAPDITYMGSTAFLVGASGMYQGAVIPIPTEGILIGRDPNAANIIIHDTNVSKIHAKVSLHPQSFDMVIVEDLSSTNGTFFQEGNNNVQQWYPLHTSRAFGAATHAQIRIGTTNEIFNITFEM